jgi:hypothetical protein
VVQVDVRASLADGSGLQGTVDVGIVSGRQSGGPGLRFNPKLRDPNVHEAKAQTGSFRSHGGINDSYAGRLWSTLSREHVESKTDRRSIIAALSFQDERLGDFLAGK